MSAQGLYLCPLVLRRRFVAFEFLISVDPQKKSHTTNVVWLFLVIRTVIAPRERAVS